MEIIHEKSHEGHLPELTGLWVIPPTQTDIIRSYHEVIESKGDLDHTNELRFESNSERDFIDLSDSYIEIKFQVICDAGSIVTAQNVAPCNLFAHALFDKITLTDRSGRALSNLNESRYPYQAMLMTLLSKNKNWGSSAGQLEGWYADTPAQHETKGAANTGFISRKNLILATGADVEAPTVTTILKPFLGMFDQRRLLLSDMSLRLIVRRSRAEFCLIAAAAVAGLRIRITSARWFLKRVELTPGALNFNVEKMSKEPALYPMNRVLFYQQQISGISQFRLKDIWAGPLPNYVVLSIVKSTAYEGTITENCFNFANYNLTRLQLTAGSRDIPDTAYEPKFNGTNVADSSVNRELLSTLEVTGKAFGPDGNLLDLASYVGGNAIYCFDLTADHCKGAHWSLTHRGSLSISGTFATAPAHAVTIVAVGIVSSVVEVNVDRSITTDFTD